MMDFEAVDKKKAQTRAIKDIEVVHELQVRGTSLDKKQVELLAGNIDEVYSKSPLVLCRIKDKAEEGLKGKEVLVSGHHRRAAYLEAGRDTARVKVFEGTYQDAYDYAVWSNSRHGVCVPESTRKYWVLHYLHLSNNEYTVVAIAEVTGMGQTHVRNLQQMEYADTTLKEAAKGLPEKRFRIVNHADISPEDRVKLAATAVKHGYTGPEIKNIVEKAKASSPEIKEALLTGELNPFSAADSSLLLLKHKVETRWLDASSSLSQLRTIRVEQGADILDYIISDNSGFESELVGSIELLQEILARVRQPVSLKLVQGGV